MGDLMSSVLKMPAARFALHYAEMVAVMFAGMGLLYVPLKLAFDGVGVNLGPAEPELALALMGLTMTVPMAGWMSWRGHSREATLEMAAAMVAPTLAAVAVAASGVLTDYGTLMGIEHMAMLGAMFAVMLRRREEYAA